MGDIFEVNSVSLSSEETSNGGAASTKVAYGLFVIKPTWIRNVRIVATKGIL